MKFLTIIFMFGMQISFLQGISAQQLTLVSSGGGNIDVGNVRGSYSIGEPLIETFSSSPSSITQGFQQSFVLTTSTNEPNRPKVEAKTYPNPCTTELFIEFQSDAPIGFIRIDDIKGRVLFMKQLETVDLEGAYRIPTDNLPAGFHIMSLLSPRKNILHSFTIVKL